MINYKSFEKVILRTPINSCQCKNNPNLHLDYFCNKFLFRQSIKLASPSLYNEYTKWYVRGSLKNKKSEERLLISIYKYYVRSCMRCTPFGLFAGLNIGKISLTEKTEITLSPKDKNIPHTRLDMNYLCSLIRDIEKQLENREQLTYYVNNSLYEIGNKIRYVELVVDAISITSKVQKNKLY